MKRCTLVASSPLRTGCFFIFISNKVSAYDFSIFYFLALSFRLLEDRKLLSSMSSLLCRSWCGKLFQIGLLLHFLRSYSTAMFSSYINSIAYLDFSRVLQLFYLSIPFDFCMVGCQLILILILLAPF